MNIGLWEIENYSKIIQNIKVSLNGEIITGVIYADEEDGFVVCIDPDYENHSFTKIFEGKVQIILSQSDRKFVQIIKGNKKED